MRSLWVAIGLAAALLVAAALWRVVEQREGIGRGARLADSLPSPGDEWEPPGNLLASYEPPFTEPVEAPPARLSPPQLAEIEELRRQFGSPIPTLESGIGAEAASFSRELQKVAGAEEDVAPVAGAENSPADPPNAAAAAPFPEPPRRIARPRFFRFRGSR